MGLPQPKAEIPRNTSEPREELCWMHRQGCLCHCTAAPVLGMDRLCASSGGCESYGIIEWTGLKRTTMIIHFQPPDMCRVAKHQSRLPRTTSSLALNASRDRATTTSLGNLF